MQVFLVGHAVSPFRGSEPGCTWNWAWEIARHVPVHVLAHPVYRGEVEKYLAENFNPRLTFTWVELPGWDPWDQVSERGIRLHYLLWLRQVRRVLTTLLRGRGQLVHHVSWGTVSVPPPFLNLGAPVLWGPVGGGQVSPLPFLPYFGRTIFREVARSIRVWSLPLNPLWRQRLKGYSLIFATNEETATLLRRAGAKRVVPFLDAGVSYAFSDPPQVPDRSSNNLSLLWAGRLEPRKAPLLALEALVRVSMPVNLLIAGDGPLRQELERRAQAMGLGERVRFLGWVPYTEMASLFKEVDAFLFTSIRDSFGSVVLEAMAFGLPIITLNHQGVKVFVPPDAGIKVPVTTPSETVRALAEAIDELAQNPSLRGRLSQGAWEAAQGERWDKRAERMLVYYEEVLSGAHRHF